MKLVFHGLLRDMYGPEATINGDVPADVIEGFFSQQPEHPRDMVIDAVGFDTEEKLHAQTDHEELHLIPAMFGGGGTFGKIALGAALIGLAFVPVIGGLLGGAILKTVLISMGASLALQGVMGLFFKAPTNSKSEDPPPSKYLGLGTNTVAQGTPITVAVGRVQLAGHWLSLQADADKLVMGQFPENPT